jgi:ribosomal protein S12 methylthiotransferase accessory factor
MSAIVMVVGAGQLAELVSEELSAKYEVVRQCVLDSELPKAVDLVLVLDDTWFPLVHHKTEVILQTAGIPWLRGFVAFGEGIIGPMVRPGQSGCSKCADLRRLMADSDRKELWGMQQELMTNGREHADIWASRTGLYQLTHLLIAETERFFQGGDVRTDGHLYLVNMQTLKISLHHFLPDPQCPVCGHLPTDTQIAAQVSLQPSMKQSIDSFRCRPLTQLKDALIRDYLDYRTGCLNGKMYDLVSPFASVSVNLPLIMGDEGAAGRTHSYADSELTAILEGLERYCGLTPRGKRTGVFDCYNNLKDHALNPLQVGVHANEQYAMPSFPFKPFNPRRPISWVWGYSLVQERPLLVPELLAYYSLGCGDGFVYETSNGCAVGGSLEEAIFYGILEVVERDSFLMTWYGQLPLPRLDLNSTDDVELRLMVERLRAIAGFDLHVFNSTMENGIPSVWAIAKNRKQHGVNLICAAGAHLDPIRAIKSAIHELAGMMFSLDEKFEENRDKSMQMLYDSSRVRHMEDHSMLYSLPQAQERLSFLLDGNRKLYTLDDAFMKKTKHADLTEDLLDLVDVFRNVKLDVIVVDQTTPELKRNGLHCVKVLIPGMLPMTFGHHLTRLEGLERVLRVPMELGYVQQPLTKEQLNPYPHPFP